LRLLAAFRNRNS